MEAHTSGPFAIILSPVKQIIGLNFVLNNKNLPKITLSKNEWLHKDTPPLLFLDT